MQPPMISIIIVNYNGKRFLDECLRSIERSKYISYEVILGDNASNDGSVEYTRRNYPSVKIIENKENLGFALANNNASALARGKYLFFLNNDAKIDEITLSGLAQRFEKDKNFGIYACKILSYDGQTHFHTGIGLDIFGFPVNNNKIFYAEGSALMIKKEFFELLGGFDEKYFMFHEDIDLAWRTWLLGYRVTAVPEAVVYHLAGGSAGGGFSGNKKYKTTVSRRYFSEANNIRTLLKNYSINYLILILPIYFLINAAEMLLFLLVLKPKVSLCYIKAYVWNLINLKSTLLRRKRIQSIRKIPDKEIIAKMHKGIGKLLIFRRINIPDFA